ncbi:PilN domain-containing protein [Pelotalea chapellei]|uniref:PilN domain-containing protein n=1 Tax=Pelotalea chapellei TaxID=44671 RepID=A0ABS5U702_9BACT|nr:PilN domain-containing protein [Pelotalea chapellei]MBT1071435.1 PilN domain-containing protein [Pelotalea chapellei]
MRFTINLATRTYLDHRKVNLVIGVVISLLLVLLVWNIIKFSWNFGELRRLTADIVSIEGRLNSRPAGVSEAEYNRILASIKFFNAVIEKKSINWVGLLNQLEIATPEGVSLSSLAPEGPNGEMKIEGRAKSFMQVRTYLEKLEDSKFFTQVLLLSHRDITVGERTRGVTFSISCRPVIR